MPKMVKFIFRLFQICIDIHIYKWYNVKRQIRASRRAFAFLARGNTFIKIAIPPTVSEGGAAFLWGCLLKKYQSLAARKTTTIRTIRKEKIRKRSKEGIMMKITVCIGSSCHIKGSRRVVERLQNLIAEHKIGEKVELMGTFCMGNCQQGVCVTVDDAFHSVTPETVDEFFATQVLAKV